MKYRLKTIFSSIAAVTAVLFAVSCSMNTSDNETKNDGKAYISFGFTEQGAQADLSARTVEAAFDQSSLTDITIKAKSTAEGSEEQTLVSGKTYSDLSGIKVMLEEGTYTFSAECVLGMYKYSGSIGATEIKIGTNSLSFALTKIGTVSVTGDGSFSITMNVTDTTVKSVKAVLMDYEETAVVEGAESSWKASEVTDGAYVFEGDVEAGTYTVIFYFYGDEEGLVKLGSYREVVNVAPDLTSSASRSTDKVNEMYSITANLNGGTLADGQTLATGYSRVSGTVTLPTLVKTGYSFAGWFTDEDCTEGNEITTVSYAVNGTSGVTIYASWQQNTVDFTVGEKEFTLTVDSGSVTATSIEGAAYSWYVDGTKVDGVTGNVLSASAITGGNGWYNVMACVVLDGALYTKSVMFEKNVPDVSIESVFEEGNVTRLEFVTSDGTIVWEGTYTATDDANGTFTCTKMLVGENDYSEYAQYYPGARTDSIVLIDFGETTDCFEIDTEKSTYGFCAEWASSFGDTDITLYINDVEIPLTKDLLMMIEEGVTILNPQGDVSGLGGSAKLTAILMVNNAVLSKDLITWATSDSKIAGISGSWLYYGTGNDYTAGTATITASATVDGTVYSKSITVTGL